MRTFKTISDCGDVVVGNKAVLFHIPNRKGDGTTLVKIFDWGEYETNEHNYVTCVRGMFNVYQNDMTNGNDADIITQLNGIYYIYAYNGVVMFEQRG